MPVGPKLVGRHQHDVLPRGVCHWGLLFSTIVSEAKAIVVHNWRREMREMLQKEKR